MKVIIVGMHTDYENPSYQIESAVVRAAAEYIEKGREDKNTTKIVSSSILDPFKRKGGVTEDELCEIIVNEKPDLALFLHSCNPKANQANVITKGYGVGVAESRPLEAVENLIASNLQFKVPDLGITEWDYNRGSVLKDKTHKANIPTCLIYIGNAEALASAFYTNFDLMTRYKSVSEYLKALGQRAGREIIAGLDNGLEALEDKYPQFKDSKNIIQAILTSNPSAEDGAAVTEGISTTPTTTATTPQTPAWTDKPSYELVEEPIEIVDYDIPTASKPSIQASISAAAETSLMNIHDKQLTLTCDYLVFFDDVEMNDFVLSYSCSSSVQGGMARASVSLIYAPQFNKIAVGDNVSDGIDNGTQLRIFMRNVFSDSYVMVFDGIIKQKVLQRDASGFTLSFSAIDYMYWMNKIIAPISIPFNDAVSPGERLKWKAQSVDPDTTAKVEISQAGSLKGKTLTEYFETLKEKSFTNSKIYSEANSVANWDDVINRVEIMGDINELLVKDEVIDFVINSNSVFADTVYVSLSNTTQALLMEMYQDRDGIVRIKPPFWNEPVLKSHVIDPMMVLSAQESTDWNKYYTRIIVTGGVEEWMDSDTNTSQKIDLLTPVGVYLGSLTDKSKAQWADYTSEGVTPSSYDNTKMMGGTPVAGGSVGGNSDVSNISNKSVQEFLNTMGGSKPVEWNTGGSGTQCVELPMYYAEVCFGAKTKNIPHEDGKNLYKAMADQHPDLFEKIVWTAGTQIHAGDMMSTSSPTAVEGHALVVKSVNGNSIRMLDQWKGGAQIREVDWTLSGNTINYGTQTRTIYGLARPKNI